MNLYLSSAYGCYQLTPVNKRIRARMRREQDCDSALFQTDWDFPGLARALGWNMRLHRRDNCGHRSTDGTVGCPDCGATASEFIAAARTWLDGHCGLIFRNKGGEYFND